MTPVSLKFPEFLRGKSEFGLLAICSQTFPLSVLLAFKTIWFCHENFPYYDNFDLQTTPALLKN